DEFAHARIGAITATQHARSQEEPEILIEPPRVGLDLTIGPWAFQPERAPGPDGTRAAPSGRIAEYSRELRHREALERIGPIDEHHVGIVVVIDIDTARRDLEGRRRIVSLPLEGPL